MLNIDYIIYNSIISGELQPHQACFEEEVFLKDISDKYFIKKTIIDSEDPISTIETTAKLLYPNAKNVEVEVTYEEGGGVSALYKNTDDNYLEDLIDLNIWPYFDKKTEFFYFFIEQEHERLRKEIKIFFDECNEAIQATFFAEKSIQILKDLAADSQVYFLRLKKPGIDDSSNSNTYVLGLVKEFLIRLIEFIQTLFQPFLNVPPQSEDSLRFELFNYVSPHNNPELMERLFNILPIKSFEEAVRFINGGLFEVEMFMRGRIKTVKFFNLLTGFKRFQEELVKLENFTQVNKELFLKYWYIIREIRYNHEQGNHKIPDNIENPNFEKMIAYVYKLDISLPDIIESLDIYEEEKEHSILDILDPNSKSSILDQKRVIQESSGTQKTDAKPLPHSFKYLHFETKPANINDLFHSMKQAKFIADDTELKNFKKIFSGNRIEKPIVWIGGKSTLTFFIKSLHDNHKKIEDLNKMQWAVAVNCFIDPSLKPFDRRNLSIQKSPAAASKKIDVLVEAL